MTIRQNPQENTRTLALSSLLRRLWCQLSRHRRRQFILLFGLVMVSAFTELVSLGAVVPFLAVLSSPGRAFEYHAVAVVAKFLGITTPSDMVLPLSMLFAAAALLAGGIRLLVLWIGIRVAHNTGSDLSSDAYRRTLYQPYKVHVSRNSSEVIDGLNAKVQSAVAVLQNLMTLASSVVLMLSIMLALLVISVKVTTVATICFGGAYGLISWMYRKRLARNSMLVARDGPAKTKAQQEGLGGIRDILLDGTQELYCDIFQRSDYPYRLATGDTNFIAISPRVVVEAIGMVVLASLAYVIMSQPEGVSSAILVLGTMALGAQRLLPALQTAYSSWVNILGSRYSLFDALALLDQPLPMEALRPAPPPLHFQESIRFENVRFRYLDDGPWVLDGINMTIPRGLRVGLVGGTGSGKSTLLDLLMGLMDPTEGVVLVDNLPISGHRLRAWRRTIAHVPQSIYLADTSLAENIAFGVQRDKIDMERVRQAARQARIEDFIESSSEGYGVMVGERGVRLSGGQRQRIGIARALYKQSTVLVFDEATSALDNTTEQEVMDAIDGLADNLTVIMVAHRLTTVKRCDVIFELSHGKVVGQGNYESLLECSPSFLQMASI